jgi:hypothetical protein
MRRLRMRRVSLGLLLPGAVAAVAFGLLAHGSYLFFAPRMGPLGFQWVRFRQGLVPGLLVTGWLGGIVVATICAMDMRQSRARARVAAGRCPHCGYESALREVCPECGRSPAAKSRRGLSWIAVSVGMGWLAGLLGGSALAEARICWDEAAFKREFPAGSAAGWRARKVPMGGELSWDPASGYWGTDD